MTRESERTRRLPHHVADYGTGPAALRRMREATSALSEITYGGPSDRFAARISSYEMTSALLLEARVPRIRYDRSPLHVTRSRVDHYLVVTYLRGESRQVTGARELVITPGDIGVFDLTHPMRTLTVPSPGDRSARHITLILPRTLLAPLLPTSGTLDPQRIPGDGPYGRILRGLLVEMWRSAEQLSPDETEPMTATVATLVAGALRPALGNSLDVAAAAHAATRDAIQRFLDRSDPQPDEIGVAALCQRFHISRATLYRMFEPDGGLVRYLRERQLRHALEVIASPAQRHRKIVDIALQHGFTTESGFIRAFRRYFGLSPGEARLESSSILVDLRAGARRSRT
jgi:AraC-like DNA-binding protein